MPLLTKVVPIALVLAAWELIARLGFVNPNVFPPVTDIVLRWFAIMADGRIAAPLYGTMWRSLLGLAGAILVGVPLGLLMGRVRLIEWFFEPLFAFGFSLPKIALIPLYVSWFGIFSLSKVMVIFTDCLFPIVIFSYHGARGLSSMYVWSAQARGTRRVRMLWRIVLPLSLASIYDGVQVAVVVAVLAAVVSEMVSGGGGLGELMIRSYRFGDVRTAFATLVTISLVGFAFFKLTHWLRSYFLHWHVSEA